jgi:hypothetical protein
MDLGLHDHSKIKSIQNSWILEVPLAIWIFHLISWRMDGPLTIPSQNMSTTTSALWYEIYLPFLCFALIYLILAL